MPRLRTLFCFFLLFIASPLEASVEIALKGQSPVVIDEIYLREGVSYLPADDALEAINLQGDWDSVEHVYRIKTPRGTAVISPGSRYLRLGERFVPLEHPPRFLDGRLRVAEDLISRHLPSLLRLPVYYRNLNPTTVSTQGEESSLDRLFAFLLRKKKPADNGSSLRGVAIDPGHGGQQDPGAIGPGGIKEKDAALEVSIKLQKQLKMRLGIPVFISRDGDYALDREQRLKPATHPEADALILLHAQASFREEPRGVTLFIRPFEENPEEGDRDESVRLATHIREAMETADLEVDGIIQAPLLPLGRGNLPTVLIEMGYLTNTEDRQMLQNPEEQQKLAEAIFEGLETFAERQEKTQ